MRRRASSVAQNDHLAKILEESDESGTRLWFKNVMSVLAIMVVGAAGWALAYESGAWRPSDTSRDTEEEKMAAGAQILGYASAVAYLGARIPQIIKNAREKSCEGKQSLSWTCGRISANEMTQDSRCCSSFSRLWAISPMARAFSVIRRSMSM